MIGRKRKRTFASLHNFRDVGGCAASSGRRVHTGRLYRSDTLTKLTPRDLARFERLGIRTVVDLRRPSEVAEFGRIAEATHRRYLNIPPEHELWAPVPFDERLPTGRWLADRYLELATDGRVEIAAVVSTLADEGSSPVVVHCFAGKDRTGVVIAVTLALLGVPDDSIADDYERSQEWTRLSAPEGIPNHWATAPREAIMLFLADLRERYGSVEQFAATGGVTDAEVAALRAHMLG